MIRAKSGLRPGRVALTGVNRESVGRVGSAWYELGYNLCKLLFLLGNYRDLLTSPRLRCHALMVPKRDGNTSVFQGLKASGNTRGSNARSLICQS